MVDHVNALRTIGEHLESLEDPVADKDMVMILLSSLPSEFNNLITTLETLKEEKLTWTYVRDRVINEYERKKDEKNETKKKNSKADQDALFSGSGGGGNKQNKGGNQKFKCHYCQKKGHFQKDCKKKLADEAEKKKAGANNADSSFCDSVSSLEIDTCSWDSAIALAADCEPDCDDEDDFIEIEELVRQADMKLEDENYIPASEIATCSWDSAIALAADCEPDCDDEDDFIEIEELVR